KQFLSSLIADSWLDLVVLTKMDTGGIVDRFGRIVCIPYLTAECGSQPVAARSLVQRFSGLFAPRTITRNVELEMVLNGWAWVLDRYGPDETYFEALEDARRWRRGIWAYRDNVHPWEFKKQKYRQRRTGKASTAQPSLFTQGSQKKHCPNVCCDGHMIQRSGKFGPFAGCSNFPKCKFTEACT
ncbi:MAG: topoisomerase DNA-binding C4 zinc finger domain-containing protein, partial [Sphingorhabdus sp.]